MDDSGLFQEFSMHFWRGESFLRSWREWAYLTEPRYHVTGDEINARESGFPTNKTLDSSDYTFKHYFGER